MRNLTMIAISLFYYCRKVFIVMNIWIVGKNSIKYRYLEMKIFTVTVKITEDNTDYALVIIMQIMRTQKEFEIKIFEEIS